MLQFILMLTGTCTSRTVRELRCSACKTTDLYYFLSRYCTAYSNHMFIMSPPTSLLTYLRKWWQVLWTILIKCLWISRIIVKQTNSNGRTFNMFNIIETLRNYFTRKLLPDFLSK